MALRRCLTAVVCMSFLSTDSLMTQRKHEAAIETRRLSVLPDYEKILGDHPFVATTLSWIANSYHALGDYDNAINATRRALEIQEKFLGEHQETARSLYDLGVALSEKKEYERWVVIFLGIPSRETCKKVDKVCI